MMGVILLDSGSTVDLIQDHRLLENITPNEKTCKISTNGGEVYVRKVGVLLGYGKVWFHQGPVAYLLFLSSVKKKFRVTYGSEVEDSFTVNKPGAP